MNDNEKRYNGWTNYETWVTALWLDNDRATQCYWREATSECRAAAPSARQVQNGHWTIRGIGTVHAGRPAQGRNHRRCAHRRGFALGRLAWRSLARSQLAGDRRPLPGRRIATCQKPRNHCGEASGLAAHLARGDTLQRTERISNRQRIRSRPVDTQQVLKRRPRQSTP